MMMIFTLLLNFFTFYAYGRINIDQKIKEPPYNT